MATSATINRMKAEIEQLRAERDALQARLAKVRERLNIDVLIKITEDFTDDRNFDYYIDFANEIHSAIIERLGGE